MQHEMSIDAEVSAPTSTSRYLRLKYAGSTGEGMFQMRSDASGGGSSMALDRLCCLIPDDGGVGWVPSDEVLNLVIEAYREFTSNPSASEFSWAKRVVTLGLKFPVLPLNVRVEAVGFLYYQGMTLAAIAPVIGSSTPTLSRDVKKFVPPGQPSSSGKGVDGKSYLRTSVRSRAIGSATPVKSGDRKAAFLAAIGAESAVDPVMDAYAQVRISAHHLVQALRDVDKKDRARRGVDGDSSVVSTDEETRMAIEIMRSCGLAQGLAQNLARRKKVRV